MIGEAIILAGGLGTRLQGVVKDLPKPMAPINGKPFLQYLLNYLHGEGIRRVVLSVGHKHESISSFFGNGYRSIAIDYAVEGTPLGTGGGIALALQKTTLPHVFILNGDTFFPIPLAQLEEKHLHTQAETTIALKETDEAGRYGTVRLGEGTMITAFEEKGKSGKALINGGIYLVNKELFEKRNFNEKFSFEKDYLEKVIAERAIAGSVFENYFLDIGIPESLARAQDDFQQFG
jgi:D-glycero-alpha-D-manno-heptose 1-phosphate guanylyltransferase